MNKRYVTGMAVLMGLCTGTLAFASEKSTASKPKPGVVEAAAMSVSGTVETIDYNTRMVTLKQANGETISMEVGPEATRFNEVKKGDQVKIDYLESVAVSVQDPHATVDSTEGAGKVIVRNKTKKPSGTAIETRVATATVVKIDAKKRQATLKGPDGKTFDIEIAPDVTHLENVKKGDQVVVKYTQTLAVAVSKP
jgi:Cu/Ag efflux protein CusF